MNVFSRMVNFFDIKFLYLFNHRLKCLVFDKFFPNITHLGGAFFTIPISFLLLISNTSLQMAGLLSLMSLTTSHIFISFMKKIWVRKRPFDTLQNIHLFKHHLKDYSFPSGHTTASTSIAFSLAIIYPNVFLIIILYPIVIGISRIYIGVHYPTDVFVGMLIGFIFPYINYLIIMRFI